MRSSARSSMRRRRLTLWSMITSTATEGCDWAKRFSTCGQHAFAIVVRRADAHHARNVGDDELRHRLAVDRKHAPRIAEQHLAVRRQRHRARVARKDRAAENVLQLLDLHGNGRRRAEHGRRCGGEAAGFGDRDEGAQDVEVEQRKRVIERGVHAADPSNSLIQTISSFRLIEHQIREIVNVIEGFLIWPDQQQSRNRKPAVRSEAETGDAYLGSSGPGKGQDNKRGSVMSILSSIGRIAAEFSAARARHQTEADHPFAADRTSEGHRLARRLRQGQRLPSRRWLLGGNEIIVKTQNQRPAACSRHPAGLLSA